MNSQKALLVQRIQGLPADISHYLAAYLMLPNQREDKSVEDMTVSINEEALEGFLQRIRRASHIVDFSQSLRGESLEVLYRVVDYTPEDRFHDPLPEVAGSLFFKYLVLAADETKVNRLYEVTLSSAAKAS